jgi:putative spermidine/putrescine transport system permease protein
VQRARGPVSAYYLLASVDLARDAEGRIERAPENQRIYVDVLLRTVGISATVTLLCLLLGFPVALLLTQVRDRTADWLMISCCCRSGRRCSCAPPRGSSCCSARASSTACC